MKQEPLKTLASQSGFDVETLCSPYHGGFPSAEGGDKAWQNLVIFEKEDLEKFAELIVRECVHIVKENYDETLPWGGVDDALIDFGITDE